MFAVAETSNAEHILQAGVAFLLDTSGTRHSWRRILRMERNGYQSTVSLLFAAT